LHPLKKLTHCMQSINSVIFKYIISIRILLSRLKELYCDDTKIRFYICFLFRAENCMELEIIIKLFSNF